MTRKLAIIATRLCGGIILGLVAGCACMFAHQLSEFIHPLDWWYSLRVYCAAGGASGFIVGLVWGIATAFEPRQGMSAPPDSE